MARVQYSPLIVGASGKVKDTVFSRWKGRAYIRARVIPSNPQTVDQMAVRDSMSRTVSLWQTLDALIKTAWGVYASPYSLSGYNSFVSKNRALEQILELLEGVPMNKDVPDMNEVTAVTGDSQGEIKFTWDKGTYVGTDRISVFFRESDTNVMSNFEDELADYDAESAAKAGLLPNTLYNCYIFRKRDGDLASPYGKSWSTAKVRAHV